MSSLIALAAEYRGTSYATPYYTLPWNLFQGKIQTVPYYVSNAANNIVAGIATSAQPYASKVTAYQGMATTTTVPTFNSLYNSSIAGTANQGSVITKSSPSKNGHDEYSTDVYWNYTLENTISPVSDTSNKLHIFSVNLNTTPGFYVVDLAHQRVDTSGCCDCDCNCDASGTAPILNGYINYDETLGGGVGTNLASINNGVAGGVQVTALVPASGIPLQVVDGSVRYWITGNVIWFIVENTAATTLTANISISLSFQVKERPLPQNLSQYSAAILNNY